MKLDVIHLQEFGGFFFAFLHILSFFPCSVFAPAPSHSLMLIHLFAVSTPLALNLHTAPRSIPGSGTAGGPGATGLTQAWLRALPAANRQRFAPVTPPPSTDLLPGLREAVSEDALRNVPQAATALRQACTTQTGGAESPVLQETRVPVHRCGLPAPRTGPGTLALCGRSPQ